MRNGFVVDDATTALHLEGPRPVDLETDVQLNGFFRDPDTTYLVCDDSLTGASNQNGFLRGSTGAPVVVFDDTDATPQNGFLRSPEGMLVITLDDTDATPQNGFLRSPEGALVVA
jgi:hypothetical protein